MWWLAAVAGWGCGGAEQRFVLVGEVIETRPPDQVVVAHEAIPGFMDAMTMPLRVADPAALAALDPGDRIAGQLVVGAEGTVLRDVRVTTPAPEPPLEPPELAPGESVPEGAVFPATPVRLAVGSPVTLGQGQQGRWAVTFVYTRCPIPEYCPLVVTRFQALQQALPEGARLLAITLDPEHDTRSVLAAFGESAGAVPGRWDFGVVPDEVLFGLAEKAGLKTTGKGLGIVHDLVLLVLDEQGRLVKRYHDMAWDQDEVVALLQSR